MTLLGELYPNNSCWWRPQTRPTIREEYDVSMGQISALNMLVCSRRAFVEVAMFRIFFQIHDFARRFTRAK